MMGHFFEYSDAEHAYYKDGILVPSVTQILADAGLLSPFRFNKEAADRGTRVHELCAQDDAARLRGRQIPKPLRGYLDAWRLWRMVAGFQPELSEARVDCDDPLYAGRLDAVGTRNGQTAYRTIVDIKTGVVGEATGLQLVAYAHALEHGEVMERIAVQLKPNGTFAIKLWKPADFSIDLYRWLALAREHGQN